MTGDRLTLETADEAEVYRAIFIAEATGPIERRPSAIDNAEDAVRAYRDRLPAAQGWHGVAIDAIRRCNLHSRNLSDVRDAMASITDITEDDADLAGIIDKLGERIPADVGASWALERWDQWGLAALGYSGGVRVWGRVRMRARLAKLVRMGLSKRLPASDEGADVDLVRKMASACFDSGQGIVTGETCPDGDPLLIAEETRDSVIALYDAVVAIYGDEAESMGGAYGDAFDVIGAALGQFSVVHKALRADSHEDGIEGALSDLISKRGPTEGANDAGGEPPPGWKRDDVLGYRLVSEDGRADITIFDDTVRVDADRQPYGVPLAAINWLAASKGERPPTGGVSPPTRSSRVRVGATMPAPMPSPPPTKGVDAFFGTLSSDETETDEEFLASLDSPEPSVPDAPGWLWTGQGRADLIVRRGDGRLTLGGLETALTVAGDGEGWELRHDADGPLGRAESKKSAVQIAEGVVMRGGRCLRGVQSQSRAVATFDAVWAEWWGDRGGYYTANPGKWITDAERVCRHFFTEGGAPASDAALAAVGAIERHAGHIKSNADGGVNPRKLTRDEYINKWWHTCVSFEGAPDRTPARAKDMAGRSWDRKHPDPE